jgi:DNA polymerase-3 subunit epsilon
MQSGIKKSLSILNRLKSFLSNSDNSIKTRTAADLKIDWNKIDDDLVIFDLETTGLRTNKVAVDIVEIAAIKFSKNELKEKQETISFHALIKPHRGGINKEAARINGITQSMIDKEGEDAEKVINDFIDFVGAKRLVAYNVDFDRWFLQREISHWGIKKQFKYECAYQLSREVFDDLENYKLATVAKSLGLPTKGSHRALHDCIMTLWVYLVAKSNVVILPVQKRARTKKDQLDILTDPYKPIPNSNGSFFGKTVFVNGHFGLKNPKKEMARIADAGFKLVNHVGVTTDYIVVVSDSLLNFNSKNLRKAQEMKSKGHRIEIMLHKDFFKLL